MLRTIGFSIPVAELLPGSAINGRSSSAVIGELCVFFKINHDSAPIWLKNRAQIRHFWLFQILPYGFLKFRLDC